MFGIGMGELLIILGIVVLLFGTKRLATLGSDLGRAMKGFRSAMTDEGGSAPLHARMIESEVERTRPAQARKQDLHV